MPDGKPMSEIVREYGETQAENALDLAGEWRMWAEELDVLIRDMPRLIGPWTYDEDGEIGLVPMGAQHVVPSAMRDRLYVMLANADAAAGALTRAAVLASEQANALANAFAIDEAEGVLVPTVVEPAAVDGVVAGHLPCPECSAQPWRPHDPDCPTLVPVVVADDGTPAALDALAVAGDER